MACSEQIASSKLAANYFPLFNDAFVAYIKVLLDMESDALTWSSEFTAFMDVCLATHYRS